MGLFESIPQRDIPKLTHFSEGTPKRVIGIQCRPKSDIPQNVASDLFHQSLWLEISSLILEDVEN